MKNLVDFKGIKNIYSGPFVVLKHTLEDFFAARVRFQFNVLSAYKTDYNIDIINNPDRNVYIDESNNRVFLISYVKTEDIPHRYYLGVSIESPYVPYINPNIFNITARTIGLLLSDESKYLFRNCLNVFDGSFINLIISRFIKIGSQSKFLFVLNRFRDLRATTFEGHYFSTGLIITRNITEYRTANNRNGFYAKLSNELTRRVDGRLDYRFWYLVDGKQSFYVTDNKLFKIENVFITNGEENFVNNMLLDKTLHGNDVLLRVNDGRELSVINSKGLEFIHQENKWRLRDYNAIKRFIQKHFMIDDSLFDSLIKYIVYCSKTGMSSIIWIPDNEKKVMDYVMSNSLHKFVSEKPSQINIKSDSSQPVIIRMLASDGATVVSKTGKILYFGCIADLSKYTQNINEKSNVKGSGESAASILAQNGLAIKVSQDGPIKIFIQGSKGYISF